MIPARVLLLPILIPLLGGLPAHAQEAERPVSAGETIRGAGFEFRVPPGEKWTATVENEGRLVVLAHVAMGGASALFGERHAKTLQVIRDGIADPVVVADEAAVASDVFAKAEQTMQDDGVATGMYRLAKVEKGTQIYGGKTLHFMRYTASKPYAGKVRAIFLLWFPPDFSSSRVFYGVHYAVGFEADSMRMLGGFDAKPALEVMESLVATE